MTRIVLTGGPGAGKTSAASALAREMPERIVHVAEAATLVYEQLGTRWDELDPDGRRDVQRRIYALQREQEERAAADHPGRTLLLDRGTVDGSAYWPDGPEDYWRQLGTTQEAELGRYDAIVWLETCAAIGIYDGDRSNARRHEDPRMAIDRGEAVLRAWAAHPKLFRVDACQRFEDKLAAVRRLLGSMMASF